MAVSALLAAASVASLNLCTDEYLLLLARPQEIASVSWLSQDPLESPLWKLARHRPANRGTIEDVFVERPTTVLSMGGGGRASALIARRLKIKAVELRPVGSLDDVVWNFRAVAGVLGDPARAKPWITRLETLRNTSPRRSVDTIWVSGGGLTMGAPSVGADWMRLAGLRQRPLQGDRVSLETILVQPPEVLLQSRYRAGQFSRGNEWLNHPIVREAKSKRLMVDGRAWTCMGPLIIADIERLRADLK